MTNEENKASETATWVDPIVADVRRVRESIAADFDYDVSRIIAHVKAWGDERRRQMNEPHVRIASTR